VLKTTANTAAREKQVHDLLTQARADLLRVNRKSLGQVARAQFDSALGFVRQAEDAL
jgi:hypothetical protein